MMLTEQIIADAAAEVNEAMLAGLPEPGACDVEFSAWFQRKMKRVLHRGNHPVAYRVMQRAASVVLVLLIGFATVMAVSPTVRAGVYGWIKETYESCIRYDFQDRPAEHVRNARYYISGLDAEYELVESHHDGGVHFAIYQNGNGEQVHFSYTTSYANDVIYVTNEGHRIEQVTINGERGDVHISDIKGDNNIIIWCNRKNRVTFWIASSLYAEELIALAESVEPIK